MKWFRLSVAAWGAVALIGSQSFAEHAAKNTSPKSASLEATPRSAAAPKSTSEKLAPVANPAMSRPQAVTQAKSTAERVGATLEITHTNLIVRTMTFDEVARVHTTTESVTCRAFGKKGDDLGVAFSIKGGSSEGNYELFMANDGTYELLNQKGTIDEIRYRAFVGNSNLNSKPRLISAEVQGEFLEIRFEVTNMEQVSQVGSLYPPNNPKYVNVSGKMRCKVENFSDVPTTELFREKKARP